MVRFYLNLAKVLSKMRDENEYSLEQRGFDWRKVSDKLVSGDLKFEVKSDDIGDYLVLDL